MELEFEKISQNSNVDKWKHLAKMPKINGRVCVDAMNSHFPFSNNFHHDKKKKKRFR